MNSEEKGRYDSQNPVFDIYPREYDRDDECQAEQELKAASKHNDGSSATSEDDEGHIWQVHEGYSKDMGEGEHHKRRRGLELSMLIGFFALNFHFICGDILPVYMVFVVVGFILLGACLWDFSVHGIRESQRVPVRRNRRRPVN